MLFYRMLRLLILCCISLLTACSGGGGSGSGSKFNYPQTMRVNVVDNYFGTLVADPYRWLESVTALNVLSWVEAQNNFTTSYLQQIPFYTQISNRANQLYAAGFTGLSTKITHVERNGIYYYQVNKIRENQEVRERNMLPGYIREVSQDNKIYYTKAKNAKGSVLLDLNQLYPNDFIQLVNFSITTNGRYLVFNLIRNFSDLSEIRVVDLTTKKELTDDTRLNTNGSFILLDNGFFYSQSSQIVNPILSLYNYNLVNYHQIGVVNDQLVYSGNGLQYVTLSSIINNQLYFSVATSTFQNDIYQVNLGQEPWVANKFFGDGMSTVNLLGTVANSNHLLMTTTSGAALNRLIDVDPSNPAAIIPILPATSSTIVNTVISCGNNYYVETLNNGASLLAQYDLQGSQQNMIQLPDIGSVDNMACNNESQSLLEYQFSNLVLPTNVFEYDPGTQISTLTNQVNIPNFNPADYQMQEIFVPSTGGVIVSVFLAYKKGLPLNGNNPAHIYVYGGFDVPVKPNFTRNAVMLLENGGVYAVAQVRGGGEYGNAWYDAGRMFNKQNTYNDVIAVANYLIGQGYTSASKLGLEGASNGGLTTAAVVLQRPDLFKVAFPTVGVLDVLRYQYFTLGFLWNYDYGLSTNQSQFQNMIQFSPLQNVKRRSYPAMYIQTGQADTRVAPLHSYKFAATMQNTGSQNNPYLLNAFPNTSHDSGNYAREIATNKWSFYFYNLGLSVMYK